MTKVFGRYKLTFPDGEEYVYDPDNWPGRIWGQVEADLGMTYPEFNHALSRKSFKAVQWLVWYLRFEAGSVQDRLAIDVPLVQMGLEVIDDDPEEDAADTPPSESDTSSPSSPDTESDPATGTT